MRPALSDDYIVATDQLTKQFDGVTAVDHVTMGLPPGIIFGFIGPSGCGKTTTVRLLLGIYEADSGDIRVLGKTPHEFGRSTRVQIGYMPQHFVLYPELSVWENLSFAASLYAVPLRRKQRLQELLELVELEGHENKKVQNLSGGMRRRLSLATSIVHRPALLFLDEPTAGIDPVLRRKFWDYFQELKKTENSTLFVTTQYVSEAAYCDYVGVMAEGRLLMIETPADLRRRALGGDVIHLQTARFLTREELEALQAAPFVKDRLVSRLRGRMVEIIVEDGSATLPRLLDWCQAQDISVESANEYAPPFDDVFVKIIEMEEGKSYG